MYKIQPLEGFKNPYEKHFRQQRKLEIKENFQRGFVRFSKLIHPVALIIMLLGTTALLFLCFRVIKLGFTPYFGGDIYITMDYIIWGLHLPLRAILEWWKDPETHGIAD